LKKYLKENNFKFTSYWVSNTIFVRDATEELVSNLEKRQDVNFLEVNKAFKLDLGNPISENLKLEKEKEPEWNVKWIKADAVWAKGFEGKGIVVGVCFSFLFHTLLGQ
jgi:hypothetical protein